MKPRFVFLEADANRAKEAGSNHISDKNRTAWWTAHPDLIDISYHIVILGYSVDVPTSSLRPMLLGFQAVHIAMLEEENAFLRRHGVAMLSGASLICEFDDGSGSTEMR